jgi:hypothetical protein
MAQNQKVTRSKLFHWRGGQIAVISDYIPRKLLKEAQCYRQARKEAPGAVFKSESLYMLEVHIGVPHSKSGCAMLNSHEKLFMIFMNMRYTSRTRAMQHI